MDVALLVLRVVGGALGLDDAGLGWGLAALAAGLLGGLMAVGLGQLRARHFEGPRPAGA